VQSNCFVVAVAAAVLLGMGHSASAAPITTVSSIPVTNPGAITDDPSLADGAYLLPTVFDGVDNDMRIAREEIFGPVVSIIPFDTEEEALRLANATPYGLSGSIWSRDIGKAMRAARALQSGVISVNSNSSVHTEAPFGGYKMSGIGRELGMAALDLYTETKNVFIDVS